VLYGSCGWTGRLLLFLSEEGVGEDEDDDDDDDDEDDDDDDDDDDYCDGNISEGCRR